MDKKKINIVSKDSSSLVCSIKPQVAKSTFFIFSRKPIGFKGLSHEVNIFVKRPIKMNQYLCPCATGF